MQSVCVLWVCSESRLQDFSFDDEVVETLPVVAKSFLGRPGLPRCDLTLNAVTGDKNIAGIIDAPELRRISVR